MIITNKYDLPQAFVNLATEEYQVKPYEYRATSLLKGFKETLINRQFHDQITVDVSDMVWLLFGKAVHYMLEQEELKPTEVREQRLYMPFGDYTLSGQFDLYDYETKKLTDYKTASVWKIIHEDYDDWYRQGAIYAMLMEQHDMPVDTVEFVPFLKDHSKTKSLYQGDYPDHAVRKVKFNLTTDDIKWARQFVADKFEDIAMFEQMNVNDIPPCTEEERWQEPSTFAVMKEGRKSALKVEASEEDAWAWVEKKVKEKDLPKVNVEHRPGTNKKCLHYCFSSQFCNYYHHHVKPHIKPKQLEEVV